MTVSHNGSGADLGNFVRAIGTVFDMVAQGSHGQTAGSVHTPELAHSAGVLGHLQFSVADQLVRGVVAVTDPVAARSEGDALVRVGAPELLDGASQLDLGGRQFAVELVAAVEALHLAIAHLVPSQTARVVLAHEAFALVDDGTESAFVRSVGTVVSVITQLVQLHT